MTSLVNVARYHLADRTQFLLMPWGVLAFTFVVNLVIFAALPPLQPAAYTGGLLSLYVFLFLLGVMSITRSLPFGLALGVSRRTYYRGTVLLVVGLGAVFSLVLSLLQVVERWTRGWGVTMHFFRIPWILDGAWYLTWLTSFVLLVLMFIYGMWFGLVFRRWNVAGLLLFIAGQVLVALAVVLLATWTHAWVAIGHFFASLNVVGLTAVLAVVTVVLAGGGLSTMRRLTL